MALTLSSMQAEVYARGFNYLQDGGALTARVTRWLNDAMHEIDGLAEWPYLNTTATGTGTVTLTDLGIVESVTAVGLSMTLQPMDRRDLRDMFQDLTVTGAPWAWYLTGGNVVNIYPVNATTALTVDYWKVAPDLVAATDAPLMPDRFRMAIVEYAVAKAHLDAVNETSAQAARAAGDQIVGRMQTQLLAYQHQSSLPRVPAIGEDL